MGSIVFFPCDRFGAVTRHTEQPHPVERLAALIRKAAHIKASASLGCEVMLELAPNIVPMRKTSRMNAVVSAVCTYCLNKGYSDDIKRTATRLAVYRLREGHSGASSVRSATIRADHLADVYGPAKDCG